MNKIVQDYVAQKVLTFQNLLHVMLKHAFYINYGISFVIWAPQQGSSPAQKLEKH
mgnify:CR=1 FL=1